MKKYITWRNLSNVLGFIAFLLTSAIATGIIAAPDAVLYAGLAISAITFIINDDFREAYLRSLGDTEE